MRTLFWRAEVLTHHAWVPISETWSDDGDVAVVGPAEVFRALDDAGVFQRPSIPLPAYVTQVQKELPNLVPTRGFDTNIDENYDDGLPPDTVY